MLAEIDERVELRKELEREKKLIEDALGETRNVVEQREPYADALEELAALLGECLKAPSAKDVEELQEDLEYYCSLIADNEEKLEKLFSIQESLHATAPDLLKEAQRCCAVASEPISQESSKSSPSSEEVAKLFNVAHLQSRISSWLQNVSVIVDGYNVIGRVHRYNYKFRDAKLGECRDRLIRDLDYLHSQIDADWCVVFDTIHNSSESKVLGVRVVFPEGNRITSKETADERIVSEASRLVREGANVFVVTNDAELSSRCAKVGATTLSVGEVFRY